MAIMADALPVDLEDAKVKATEAAAVAKAKATEAYEAAMSMGFFSHFTEYSFELLTPWKLLTSDEGFMSAPTAKEKALYFFEKAKAEVLATITLVPGPNPSGTFIIYNVLGFYLGIFESLLGALFGGHIISLVWNGGVAFFVAYTLYWTMTCSKVAPLMKYSMVFIALYILFNVYMALQTLIFVIPACLYLGKALCDVLMLINGYHMLKTVLPPDAPMFQL